MVAVKNLSENENYNEDLMREGCIFEEDIERINEL